MGKLRIPVCSVVDLGIAPVTLPNGEHIVYNKTVNTYDKPNIASVTRNGYWLTLTGVNFIDRPLDNIEIYIKIDRGIFDKTRGFSNDNSVFKTEHDGFALVGSAFYNHVSTTEVKVSLKYLKAGWLWYIRIQARSLMSNTVNGVV